MSQVLRGRVIRTENITVGQVCGPENAVAVGVPAPVPVVENIVLAPVGG
jgi:hypothetical protein